MQDNWCKCSLSSSSGAEFSTGLYLQRCFAVTCPEKAVLLTTSIFLADSNKHVGSAHQQLCHVSFDVPLYFSPARKNSCFFAVVLPAFRPLHHCHTFRSAKMLGLWAVKLKRCWQPLPLCTCEEEQMQSVSRIRLFLPRGGIRDDALSDLAGLTFVRSRSASGLRGLEMQEYLEGSAFRIIWWWKIVIFFNRRGKKSQYLSSDNVQRRKEEMGEQLILVFYYLNIKKCEARQEMRLCSRSTPVPKHLHENPGLKQWCFSTVMFCNCNTEEKPDPLCI